MTHRFRLVCFFLLGTYLSTAQQVADQTFRLDGLSEHFYAFAEGDSLLLQVEELTGKKIKFIEFANYPDENLLFRAYELDSVLNKVISIPKTGAYVLRFKETGMSKKVCRFILNRKAKSSETARFDNQISWDIKEIPTFYIRKKSIQTGVKREMVSISGQATVNSSKFYLKKPVNAYQFTLPPNTRQWAYRIAVGQAIQEARQQDAQKLKQAFQGGAIKLMGVQPETALAAFALGMAIDLSTSKAGEDVEYALVDWKNWQAFSKGEDYSASMHQSGVSVDAQRRYAPLEGTLFFALRSDNLLDDITVNIDIEAVVETPIFETLMYLEPLRP